MSSNVPPHIYLGNAKHYGVSAHGQLADDITILQRMELEEHTRLFDSLMQANFMYAVYELNLVVY